MKIEHGGRVKMGERRPSLKNWVNMERQFERIANLQLLFRNKDSMKMLPVLPIEHRCCKKPSFDSRFFNQGVHLGIVCEHWEPGSFPGFSSCLLVMDTGCGAVS